MGWYQKLKSQFERRVLPPAGSTPAYLEGWEACSNDVTQEGNPYTGSAANISNMMEWNNGWMDFDKKHYEYTMDDFK